MNFCKVKILRNGALQKQSAHFTEEIIRSSGVKTSLPSTADLTANIAFIFFFFRFKVDIFLVEDIFNIAHGVQ